MLFSRRDVVFKTTLNAENKHDDFFDHLISEEMVSMALCLLLNDS